MAVVTRRHLIVMVLASLTCVGGWVAYVVHRAARRATAVQSLEKIGKLYSIAQTVDGDGNLACSISPSKKAKPVTIYSILKFQIHDQIYSRQMDRMSFGCELSDDTIAAILLFPELQSLQVGSSTFSDEQLARLGSLCQLTSLDLRSSTAITDNGVCSLEGTIPSLTSLYLDGSAITDKSVISFVATQNNLLSLHLSGTAISDMGVKSLVKLTRLSYLELEDTQITDASAEYLAQIKSLKELRIKGTRLTDSGLQRLTAIAGLEQLYAGPTEGGSETVTIRTRDWFYHQLPNCSVNGHFVVTPDYKSNITEEQRWAQIEAAIRNRYVNEGQAGEE